MAIDPDSLAIIAGNGELPHLLAKAAAKRGQLCGVVIFGDARPDWTADYPLIPATFEHLGTLFVDLHKAGAASVVFAGGLVRPSLDPAKFDAKTLEIAPRLLPLIGKGDDATLGAVTSIFEDEGFVVVAAHKVLADLLMPEGVLGAHRPTSADAADIRRAVEIVSALGAVDVGQGAVVAQGLCLGLESLQGTDAMLDFVGKTTSHLRPDPKGSRGVLFKGPKPGQDRRVDLPAIGPDTIERAAAAGLGGIALSAGGVLLIGAEETIDKANAHGLFLVGLVPER